MVSTDTKNYSSEVELIVLNQSKRMSGINKFWRKDNVILFAFFWAGLSLFVYMFLSGPMVGVERPIWYRATTGYIFQDIPLLMSGLLCLRNGLTKRMPSGSLVWLLMGIALLSYLLGNIFFTSWELVWHLNSTGCLGDPFFALFYVLTIAAMLILLLNQRIWLKFYQWAIVAVITGIAVFLLLAIIPAPAPESATPTPVVTEIATAKQEAPAAAEEEPDLSQVPEWVAASDRLFKPYGKTLNLFYVWSDIILLAMAMMTILGFWGGRLNNAWQVNAQALACFYIADMWYAHAGNNIEGYQSGFMLEMFWVFGSVQFAVAAAVEFDLMLSQQQRLE
jgi:hypothetical protein